MATLVFSYCTWSYLTNIKPTIILKGVRNFIWKKICKAHLDGLFFSRARLNAYFH